MLFVLLFFFFKQKTAYEMRISDWVQTCALPICIQYCITQIEQKILHESTEHCVHDALIQELAQEIRLSRFHLTRLFLKDFQHSPRDYIHRNLMGDRKSVV